jgi:hypothetical protein
MAITPDVIVIGAGVIGFFDRARDIESAHCWEAWQDHLMTIVDSPLASYRKTGAVTLEMRFRISPTRIEVP